MDTQRQNMTAGVKYFLVNRQYFVSAIISGIDKGIAPLYSCLGNIISKIIL